MTTTAVVLEVTEDTYAEIKDALTASGYDHALRDEPKRLDGSERPPLLVMTGLALRKKGS